MASLKATYKEAVFLLIKSLNDKKNTNIVFNKQTIHHLIDNTLFLGRHCLPFPGRRE